MISNFFTKQTRNTIIIEVYDLNPYLNNKMRRLFLQYQLE